MNRKLKDQIIKKGIEVFGKDFQLIMLGEECGELLTAVSQHNRGRIPLDEVVTEMADAIIMIECVMQLYGVSRDDVKTKIDCQYVKFGKRLGFEEK